VVNSAAIRCGTAHASLSLIATERVGIEQTPLGKESLPAFSFWTAWYERAGVNLRKYGELCRDPRRDTPTVVHQGTEHRANPSHCSGSIPLSGPPLELAALFRRRPLPQLLQAV
jgi:hypothetical protein